MKRKKGIPVGLVALLAVIGMGLMGVAYATGWSKTLYINGDVETGTLSAKFVSVVPADPDGAGSDSGTCTAATSTSIGGTLDDTLDITVDNAYPGFICEVTFKVNNSGTIPAKVYNPGSLSFNPVALSVTVPSCYPNPDTVAAGSDTSTTCKVKIEVLPAASQGTPYSVTATITVDQGI